MKISGGNAVRIKDYPFQVSLLHRNNQWCSGTIVSKSHVLTAAHCIVFASSYLYIRAGSSYWNKGGSIHSIVYNATYGKKLNEDLAILRVWAHFNFDETRQPISIFYRDEVISPGTMGTVIGWGMTSETTSSYQLQAVELPSLDRNKCQLIFKDTIIGKIVDGEICVGYINKNNKNICQGDSGGPLVIDQRQAGIVSMGRGCGYPNSPAIFIDTAYYNQWILEQISL
ncbi:PREDICTED: trypsin-3-like isoform X2 [Ceratosolen solmsi marchali]|nr:PREDICTED: trypsin-3-like isoform X2 [Ceratosolen solmsi marchali]